MLVNVSVLQCDSFLMLTCDRATIYTPVALGFCYSIVWEVKQNVYVSSMKQLCAYVMHRARNPIRILHIDTLLTNAENTQWQCNIFKINGNTTT